MGARRQILLDRAAVLPGMLGGERMRLFRDRGHGPGWEDHLAIPSPQLPTLTPRHPVTTTVQTLAGPMAVGLLLAHEAGADAPTIVTHHGNNERPFELEGRAKNFLNRALLGSGALPDANVLLLRAPFHDGPLRDYTRAAGDLRTWMAMLAASVVTISAAIEREPRSVRQATVVTGFSLGGWVTNLHRAFVGTADLYVPMLAGAHLGRQLVDSTYRHMVSRTARANGDALRQLLDFEAAFTAASAEVAPLLAKHDQYARPVDQRSDFGDRHVTMLDTGHVGAALAGGQLRAHLLDSIDRHLRGRQHREPAATTPSPLGAPA
jgi:hypothetical protein